MAPQVIAHRGAPREAPENTLSAFRIGWEQGADAVELDVHLSKDQKLVVMHDYTTGRMAGGLDYKVADLTADELRQFDLRWEGGATERIPLLEEVYPLVPTGKRLVIENKVGAGFIGAFGDLLRRGGIDRGQLAIIGFDFDAMKQAKAAFADIEMLWLRQGPTRLKPQPPVEELVRMALGAGLDGLNLESSFPIDRAFVERVHAAGLKLYTWTVDDAEVEKAEAEAGVDAITTNRPGWLRRQLGLGG